MALMQFSFYEEKVKEIGFVLTQKQHPNNWDSLYTILDGENVIYKTTVPSNISAWTKGYKYMTKEAWEI